MYTFLIYNNCEIKMITTTNYRNGTGNFRYCFLRIKFFDYEINLYTSGKEYLLYTCKNVDKYEQPLICFFVLP